MKLNLGPNERSPSYKPINHKRPEFNQSRGHTKFRPRQKAHWASEETRKLKFQRHSSQRRVPPDQPPSFYLPIPPRRASPVLNNNGSRQLDAFITARGADSENSRPAVTHVELRTARTAPRRTSLSQCADIRTRACGHTRPPGGFYGWLLTLASL